MHNNSGRSSDQIRSTPYQPSQSTQKLQGKSDASGNYLDADNIPMTKAERRAVISGRKRLTVVDRRSPHYGRNMESRREVNPGLRAATFRRDSNTCQHCERKFPVTSLHADHVISIARGGLTTLGNLQTLCGPCNLKKGKRLKAEL